MKTKESNDMVFRIGQALHTPGVESVQARPAWSGQAGRVVIEYFSQRGNTVGVTRGQLQTVNGQAVLDLFGRALLNSRKE